MRLGGAWLVVTALVAGCGFGGPERVEPAGSWQRLPDPPLSPRELSLGIWTGEEAVVVGGSAAPPTHPSSSGDGAAEQKPLLRDGAAFDPRSRSWRRIAPAPIGMDSIAPAAVARDSVYVAIARNPGVRHTRMDLLAYRLAEDGWDRLPSPPRRNYKLVGAGDRLLAAGPERGPVPLSLFSLGADERTWRELPRPPFRGSLVPSGRRLVMIGYDPAARDYRNPPLARAATFRFGDDQWRRLPDSDHVLWGHGFWVPVGGRLVSPELGTGNEDYDFDRPYGGILDPERGTWSELPNVPEPSEEHGSEFGTGVLTRDRLVGGLPDLLVLDTTRDDWVRVPRLWRDRRRPLHFTAVNTRRKLIVVGGARWTERHPEGELLDDAWIWTPPSPAG